MTDIEIIDEIFRIRTSNNTLWMHLLDLALTHAPTETKETLRRISRNDLAISNLTSELAK